MGLLFRPRRPVMRLAAGAATAGIAYRSGQRRAEQDAYNQQAAAAYEATEQAPPMAAAPYAAAPYPAAAPPVAAPPAAAPPGPRMGELERLAEMHASGALTDAEFSAAKAQLLGL